MKSEALVGGMCGGLFYVSLPLFKLKKKKNSRMLYSLKGVFWIRFLAFFCFFAL